MQLPISWLKDFVDLKGLSIEEIARRLTLAGLEVGEILYAGLPMPARREGEPLEFKTRGISWDPDKIVVAEIREVMPHPNADRLTLLDLFDGAQQHTVLTGAPNIFHLKGQGKLAQPLKVAYAKEGAALYDGHADGLKLMTLTRAKIRGVESYSMVCSEKELGISEEHEGIILLDPDAPVGAPLADYMGDAVLDIDISPNMARNASVMGIARELAALTGRKLRKPDLRYRTGGGSVERAVSIHIEEPKLNPRFVLGLVRDIRIQPSPYQVQRRLKLAGMRPINSVVDATNYAMLELGEPLHAFDFDTLQKRAGRGRIKMSTRSARDGESLKTLDGVTRPLTAVNVLVCDEQGPLSIAGVMGGAESEVTNNTRTVLLEGASWDFINIRRTARQHNLPSEASFRFSRGVHPALAAPGVQRGLQLMARWSGGTIAPGLVDEYPLKPKATSVAFTPADVQRILGIELSAQQIARRLGALEFKVRIHEPVRRTVAKRSTRTGAAGPRITVTAPPHRVDIGEGVVGLADVMEEIARMVGYDRIPTTSMADSLPPQVGNPAYEWEEHLRDLLVSLGFDEVVGYRLTSIDRESLVGIGEDHVRISNPIAPERSVLRRSLLASILDNLEKNMRLADSLAFFEIGPVFEPSTNGLPHEQRRLALAMAGLRNPALWDKSATPEYDFFDLKGRLELLLKALGVADASFAPALDATNLHPGKAAMISAHGLSIGSFGVLHPLTREKYDLGDSAVMIADLDLEVLYELQPQLQVTPFSPFPPVLEDIAIMLDEQIPSAQVASVIRAAGGPELVNVLLFDLYRGDQVPAGKKSLAYSLTYQAPDRTLTDRETAAIRGRIVKRLQQDLGAVLRG